MHHRNGDKPLHYAAGCDVLFKFPAGRLMGPTHPQQVMAIGPMSALRRSGKQQVKSVKRTGESARRSGVTRRGRTAPVNTLQGVTPEGKKLWANLQRIVEKRGRTGKKVWGDNVEGVTPE